MSSPHRRWLLTGGIGSGKSEVNKLLAERGIKTIDADQVGHAVLSEGALGPVSDRWPQVVLKGEIDRQALARIVFADRGELAALEKITHPLIFGRIEQELEWFSGVAVVELPLLDPQWDWPTIVVDAPDEIRLDRAMRRGMDEADVRRRMRQQPGRGEWLSAADIVVPNHGSLVELSVVVSALASWLVSMAAH